MFGSECEYSKYQHLRDSQIRCLRSLYQQYLYFIFVIIVVLFIYLFISACFTFYCTFGSKIQCRLLHVSVVVNAGCRTDVPNFFLCFNCTEADMVVNCTTTELSRYSGLSYTQVIVLLLKADSHITCCAHAVPLPCRAAKGLECVFPI